MSERQLFPYSVTPITSEPETKETTVEEKQSPKKKDEEKPSPKKKDGIPSLLSLKLPEGRLEPHKPKENIIKLMDRFHDLNQSRKYF